MCVRETEATIDKAPRLGIHTPRFERDIQQVMPSVNVITFSDRNILGFGTQFNQVRWHAVWRMRMCGGGCERGVVCAEGCERWSWGWVGRVWLGGFSIHEYFESTFLKIVWNKNYQTLQHGSLSGALVHVPHIYKRVHSKSTSPHRKCMIRRCRQFHSYNPLHKSTRSTCTCVGANPKWHESRQNHNIR